MLIRSQDKKLLINLDKMQSISICGYRVDSKNVHEDAENANTWYITCVSQDYSPFVGHYSSEAKAIKVLDKIQMANFRIEKMKMIYSHSGHLANSCIQDFTFQMPSEEEMEV